MPEETNLDVAMKGPPNDVANTTSEFYAESFAEVLAKAVGYFVVCEFVVGTNSVVEKSGQVYAVGVNFITLKEPGMERFTVCDIYSLKFATVYDTRDRPPELRSQNRNNNSNLNRMNR